MIRTDGKPTVASPPHFGTHAKPKLARDLEPGDVVIHDFRGFGQLFMSVEQQVAYTLERQVMILLSGAGLVENAVYDADKPVLTFNQNLAGTWR